MSLRVTPFQPMDYVAIQAPALDTPWIADRLAHGRARAQDGPAYTIWAGAEIACTLGLGLIWPGRATAWAVWGHVGYQHAGAIHRLTIRYTRRLIVRHQLRRIEAEVRYGGAAEQNWLEHLGFEPEGLPLFFAGPQGETMRRYVWLHPAEAEARARALAAHLDEEADMLLRIAV